MQKKLEKALQYELELTEKALGPLPEGFSLKTITNSNNDLFAVAFGFILNDCTEKKSYEPLLNFMKRVQAAEPQVLYQVRQYDGSDRLWIDVSDPVSEEEANRIWNRYTHNGTRNTRFDHFDYYKIFPVRS